ncbi:MAG: hypothetical protein E7K92_12735, partial [Serratia marcescens]|nr:hypothetical protein [Serratia marcescens]
QVSTSATVSLDYPDATFITLFDFLRWNLPAFHHELEKLFICLAVAFVIFAKVVSLDNVNIVQLDQ